MHQLRAPPPIQELFTAPSKGGGLQPWLAWLGSQGMRPPDEYLHWDDLRHRSPPAGLTREEWWAALRFMRLSRSSQLPLIDSVGRGFFFGQPDEVQALLHLVDSQARGQISIDEAILDPATRDRFVVRSLVEEAISSSQLEGASTTHKAAKQMLRSGRAPHDKSEWMILNNYEAMRRVRDNKSTPLTAEWLLDLHRVMTRNTLDDEADAGRIRTATDDVRVEDVLTREVVHVPPPADQLELRIASMCAFANGETPKFFVHPVVRSIALHFWLAYDHPFTDGNGRTARALFYWSMLKHGYWLLEFLPISKTLKRAPAQYARAYLQVETDSNDLTYFLLQQLRVLRTSLSELEQYVGRKVRELRTAEALLRHSVDLNHRQIALISHALRHPETRYTIESHRGSHDVVYATARSDLLDLERRKVLVRRRAGRTFVFEPVQRLEERLRALR